ncbi:uncharacterized protein KD926_003288 [Aspergillus affinis]|uniref:uncharacterized protein n=1 Tax=Aspergillus affinis TaxID=1070780 RepID=UPI0022FEA45E|nr:uncharacterized protein KD926_003288 [Aspergillus affinis]KAI9043518.1 hypothetical protein KD926_003288 [Aspergillus affinis]
MMADQSPSRGLASQSVIPGNLPLPSALSTSWGFSRWAQNSSPYWGLILASSALRCPLSTSDTPKSPADLKDEVEEGEIQELLSIPPEVKTIPQVKGSTWGVTLTVYGHTITRMRDDKSPERAKVEVCREALDRLGPEFPRWIVPNEPSDSPPGPGWDWCELLPKICHLLSLEHPQIKATRLEEMWSNPMGHWYAAAFFQSDLFLARARAIGEVSLGNCTVSEVQETCAQRVCQYLINMVKDTLMEQAAAKAQSVRELWGTKVMKKAMPKEHLDSMQID